MIGDTIGYEEIRISPITLIVLNRDSLLPYITAIFFIFSQAQDMILPDNIYTTNRWPHYDLTMTQKAPSLTRSYGGLFPDMKI